MTEPFPLPALDVWIQESPVAADQLHQDEEATEKLPEVAEPDKVPLEPGDNEYAQSAAAW